MADTGKDKRRRLFMRPARTAGQFAMIQPHRAIAQTAAPRKVADVKPQESRSVDATWQASAYDYAEQIGELGYAQHLRADAVATCGLTVMEIVEDDEGRITEVPTKDERALRVMDAFVGPQGGQAELLRRAALHLGIAGESYLVGIEPALPGDAPREATHGLVWEFLSTDEVKIDAGGKVTRRTDGTQAQNLPPDAYIARCWRSDARFSRRADSEMRRALNICAEIVTLSQMIGTITKSRLPHGLLFVPDELSFAAEDDEDTDDPDGGDPFIEELFKHLTTPISDPTSGAAYVPLVLRGAAEHGDKVKLIELVKPMDEWVKDLRDAALNRLYKTIDISPELVNGRSSLSGLGGGNVAAAIDIEFAVKHVFPVGRLLADFVTASYIQPMLEEFEDCSPDESHRFIVRFDPSAILSNDTLAADSASLYADGLLSGEARVTSAGFDPGQMPTEDEAKRRFLLRVVEGHMDLAPVLMPFIPGFEDVGEAIAKSKERPRRPAPGAGQATPPGPAASATPSAGDVVTARPIGSAPSAVAASAGPAGSALTDRLLVAADAAVERALEKVAGRVWTKATKSPGPTRDAAKAAPRGAVLTVLAPSDLVELGFDVEELLAGAWDSYAERARLWLAAEGWDAEAATITVRELVADLHRWTIASLHQPHSLGTSGIRVPEAVVAAVGRVSRAA